MAKSGPIRAMLSEGRGRISVGRAEEVAALVLAQPEKFSRLMECLWDRDPGVVNRAAHALERVTRDAMPVFGPILDSWKTSLLGLLPQATENKLRWHLALIVPRLELDRQECRRTAAALRSWLQDGSSIVKTMAMQGLVDLTHQDASLLPEVLDLLRILSRSGTPAMRARGRLLFIKLEAAQDTPKRERPSPGTIKPGSSRASTQRI
jgi:hypothetical protein